GEMRLAGAGGPGEEREGAGPVGIGEHMGVGKLVTFPHHEVRLGVRGRVAEFEGQLSAGALPFRRVAHFRVAGGGRLRAGRGAAGGSTAATVAVSEGSVTTAAPSAGATLRPR